MSQMALKINLKHWHEDYIEEEFPFIFIFLLNLKKMTTKSVQISNNGFKYILNSNLSTINIDI